MPYTKSGIFYTAKPTSAPKKKASTRWMQSRPPIAPYARPVGRGRGAPELKYKDTAQAFTAPGTTGAITSSTLCSMVEGNTDQTRIGNKITVKSVMIRGRARMASTNNVANTADTMRIIVYIDRQANGAAATVTDILASADWRSFNNLDNTDRFYTLCEETICMQIGGGVPSVGYLFGVANSEFFLKKTKLNLDVKYKGNAGTIADIASANIGVLAITAGGFADLEYIARIKYTDQ